MKRCADWLLIVIALAGTVAGAPAADEPASVSSSAADYPSLQAALDANRGRTLLLPAGRYTIDDKLRIRGDHSGLAGPGWIVQTNPDRPILDIENARDVAIRQVTLTRPADPPEIRASAIVAINAEGLVLDDVQALDNRSAQGVFDLRHCDRAQVRHCLVRNYMRISIDDRTKSNDWGYAFRCIDGTGISVRESTGLLIEGNRVIETTLLPTPEVAQKFNLGKFVKKNPQKGELVSQALWDAEVTQSWHQGSAIFVSSPKNTQCIQIVANYVENAAQGIDIHADRVIVAQNIINNSFMGMKAMHGARNISIIGNQFVRNDLWSIGLMPGASSHAAAPGGDGQPPRAPNTDGGSIIANNIISEFGYGNAHWIWKDGTCCPIRLDGGQKPDNPPLSGVIVQGNIIDDPGPDGVIIDGQLQHPPPRYTYALLVYQGPTAPRNLRIAQNIFPPGARGVCNVKLEE